MKFKPKTDVRKLEYEKGSGNIFADLGFENPEEELAKSDLTAKISQIIKKRKLTQMQVASILGVDQPRISSLLRGNFDLFSLDMLMRFLKILGQDIQILVKPKPTKRKQAHLTVVTSSSRSTTALAAKAR